MSIPLIILLGFQLSYDNMQLSNECLFINVFFRHGGLDAASRGPRKHWVPAGVYPDEDRGRKDDFL